MLGVGCLLLNGIISWLRDMKTIRPTMHVNGAILMVARMESSMNISGLKYESIWTAVNEFSISSES